MGTSRGKTHSSLEDTLIAPIGVGRFLHFRLGGLGVDDTILTSNLFAVSALVGRLFVSVLFQLLPKASLELTRLAVLHLVTSRSHGIGFEELDLVLDRRVEHLGLGDE